MIRLAYVDTAHTGDWLEVKGAEGVLRADRVDPHGVIVQLGGKQLSITANALAEMGRYFLAAAVKLGQDLGNPAAPDDH